MSGKTAGGGGNRLHAFISRHVVLPAQITMIASLVLRSVATVVTTSIPYSTWPLWLRILVEVCAVLGMVVCSEIILSAAAASWAVLQHQIRATEESGEYKPSPRLKGEQLARAVALLDKRKAARIALLQQEARGEIQACYVGGAITVTYGILFAISSISSLSLPVIATELALCASLPYIMFYFSARYKPDVRDPGETATAAATAAMDAKVKHSGGRIVAGDYDRGDVQVLMAAAPDTPLHKRMLEALMPANTTGLQELTTSEVYAWWGVNDQAGKAAIRRVIRKAGEAGTYIPGLEDRQEPCVRWDLDAQEWRTRALALTVLWPADRKPQPSRAPASGPRTEGEQGASTPRAEPDARTISKGHQALLDDLRRYNAAHPEAQPVAAQPVAN